MVMHRVFGEMYNLKTIAGILTRLPLSDEAAGADTPRAGPPFEMPYTLYLPTTDADIWDTLSRFASKAPKRSAGFCSVIPTPSITPT